MRTLLMTAILLTYSASASNLHEDAMKNVSFKSKYTEAITSNQITYKLNALSFSGDNNSLKDLKIIRSISNKITSDFKNSQQCKDLDLVVYYIPFLVLNDRNIMNFIKFRDDSFIDGLYDSRYSPAGHATIFIAGESWKGNS